MEEAIPGSLFMQDMLNTERNGICGSDLFGVGAVLSNAVALFKKNVHLLYIDAGFTVDKWVIMLAVFMDSNHHVQPLGFRLCASESYLNWFRFLSMLRDAGVFVSDLVINSDRHKAIASAVKDVFPEQHQHKRCEHVPCFVHIERNLQEVWNNNHDVLCETATKAIDVFNSIINHFRDACMSVNETECYGHLKCIKELELEYKDKDKKTKKKSKHPVYDYIVELNSLFMYSWKNNHMMQMTSNPVESCMSVLCRDLFQNGIIRSSSFFNRYRMLLMWIVVRIKQRDQMLNKRGIKVPLNGDKMSVYCPWSVNVIVRRGHFVECYKHVLIVHPVKKGTHRKWRSEMMKEEDGCMIQGCEQWKGDELYEVVDKAHMRVYHLDLNERSHPCDCHCTKWEKIPCIHVMKVLHWLQEYWRVWDYVGNEYRHETVQSTCRDLNEKEMELLLLLPTMKSVELDEEDMAPIIRSHKTNNGTIRKRYHSVGEDQVCVKKQRTKKCIVCFK